ncbi:carbohydrate ABC transporter permease [Sporolactobacillus sp. THM19-2]|jgi:sn-glycerol 3-phosphate transport system permease protein|uniref:carbohydrate ABC transporter permease n=1 Tax=Sporolactobacillus sp. THM19-2 TaxID=2511171 RepID=UPI00102290DF|nr:sugar ABC transporter permease [Sporolactobacillus sp. THM19-2]RYL92416.1 sugar ABC transporter permease [Sporolactobacillus sp. THM19-2]
MEKRQTEKHSWTAYVLIFPSIIIFSVFMIWPGVYTIYLSFLDWNLISPNKKFVGLENYIQLFQDPITYKIIINTFAYIVILLILNWLVPYTLSFVLEYAISKGKNFYKKVYFLPSLISLVVGSMLYTWILNPVSGPVAILFGYLGIHLPMWSNTSGLVILVLSLITSWKVFGYNFIVLLSGVSNIPQSVIEAAKIDNVPLHKIFLQIVLPMSSATGIYVFIMTIVQGLQFIFTPINVVTQGGPNYASSNLIYHSYQNAFVLYKTGESAALSTITLILFALLLLLEFRFVERRLYYAGR